MVITKPQGCLQYFLKVLQYEYHYFTKNYCNTDSNTDL